VQAIIIMIGIPLSAFQLGGLQQRKRVQVLIRFGLRHVPHCTTTHCLQVFKTFRDNLEKTLGHAPKFLVQGTL
jgi:hypothetical protein